MEQRTFFAIIISFLFLMAYNALVISPQQKTKQLTNSIEISNTVDSSVSTSVNQTAVKTAIPIDISEEEKILQIGTFQIFFGSKSGLIKRIHSEVMDYSPILTNILNLHSEQKLKSYSNTETEARFVYQFMDTSWEQTIKAVGNNKLTAKIRIIFQSDSFGSSLNFNIFDINANQIINNVEVMRDSMLFEYSHFIDNKVVRKGNAFKFTPKDTKRESGNVEWFGWRDRYHFTLVKPLFQCPGFSSNFVNQHQLHIALNNCALDPSKTYEFEVYIGPQDFDLLNSYGGNLHKIMAFSGNALLDFIEKGIYKFLLFLNKFTHNWGISIILISIIIYGVTYPLTFKSMMSMRKMQELQPKMTELREKYKNDPQKLNSEVLQLYKVHNINPLGGCLPMLLQMPVFISLYQVLWRTHNFQNAHFLWIEDLSKPDKAFILNMNFPFIGNEINVLPFLMAIVMFIQQKLSTSNIVITDPAQKMQQKMMMWIFPIFIGGIFYHFASGLTLYFTVFYIMSTLMQYKMSKMTSK